MGKLYIRYDKIWEFEHRYVIALFLQAHPEVRLIKYLKDYYFVAEVQFGTQYRKSVVCLFSTQELSAPQKKQYGVKKFRQVSYRRLRKKFSGDARYDRKVNSLFEETYRRYLADPVQHILNSVERTGTEFSHYAIDDDDSIKKNPISALIFDYYVQFIEEKDELLFKYKQLPNAKLQDSYYIKDKTIMQNFIQGEVTFMNPTWFNDPFDCDCEIPHLILKNLYREHRRYLVKSINGNTPSFETLIERYNEKYDRVRESKNSDNLQESALRETYEEMFCDDYPREYVQKRLNIKDHFRVLCMTPYYDNILMWGYYGNSGEGVCGGFHKSSIYNGVKTSQNNYIFVYGNVHYTDKVEKPKYTSQDILSFVINCVFTKSGIWSHEEERRFLLIKDDFEEDYVPIKATCEKYYLGVKTNEDEWKREYDNSPRLHTLKKHLTEYKLIE